MPRYTGLKDFVRGCQKLLKIHGNVPVFIQTKHGEVAPFGMAEKEGGNQINGCRQDNEKKEKFKRNHNMSRS